MDNYQGTIYLNHGRYWWKVRLPGQSKCSYIALRPKGSRFATKDKKLAEMLASEIWDKHLRERKPETWDGRLTTLVQLYNQHNQEYYLSPSKEAVNIGYAIFALADYYQELLADDLTPLQLKEFREHIIDNHSLSRSVINRRIGMIKRMYKWAASEMLVSIHTYRALETVEGLRRGRTVAREGRTVRPISIEAIEAVLGVVTPIIADMIKIQLLTGMRPGELVQMRPCDIDRSGPTIWVYKPEHHKTAFHGHQRFIPMGPKAQAILAPYLLRIKTDYCFKPTVSNIQARQRRHKKRKTPLSCGNRPGTNNRGIQQFNECFDTNSYRKAITRACKAAKVERWYPHQLRHTAATDIRREFGLDAARAVLGHRSPAITEVYAELDLAKAEKVAKMMG